MQGNFDEKLKMLRKFLAKQKFVSFAYLFGSHARRKAGPLSDVDIAVYLNNKSPKKMHGMELFLINKIEDILEGDEFDVVILNNLDNTFCFNVIKEGVPIKASLLMAKFEFQIMQKFLDEQYHEGLMADIALDRISKRGIL